jgi:hypothetical protein
VIGRGPLLAYKAVKKLQAEMPKLCLSATLENKPTNVPTIRPKLNSLQELRVSMSAKNRAHNSEPGMLQHVTAVMQWARVECAPLARCCLATSGAADLLLFQSQARTKHGEARFTPHTEPACALHRQSLRDSALYLA